MQSTQSLPAEFNILNYVESLTPTKRGRYICPNCNEPDLGISSLGKYKCFKCHDTKAIARILTEPQREEKRQRKESERIANTKPVQKRVATPSSAANKQIEKPLYLPGVTDVFTLNFVELVHKKVIGSLNETEREDLSRLAQLEPSHIDHLIDEGFDLHQIALWINQGLTSLSKEQAEAQNFKVRDKYGSIVSGSGLYFPFSGQFGQLRLDTPIQRENGGIAKYLTPLGAKSEARLPKGCPVVTEGAKDAAAGSLLGGIPTGAIAGVSHYRALKEGSGHTILFDADGWANPGVFSNLFHAAKWVGGKIQLLPEIEGYPKAGLCEYFKAGHTADDYEKLIESAKKPENLLMEWGKRFGKIPESRLSQSVRVALRLAAKYLDEIEQDTLLANIKTATKKVSAKTLSKELERQKAKVSGRQRKKLEDTFATVQEEDPHPEAFYRPICESKGLKFSDCVTAQSFDGWVFREEFGANEGDWRVIDSAFYRWVEGLGYWEHQPDNYINAQIADSGEKAFKLKYTKEFGWQVTKPYETNSHKESAFKYARSRLEQRGDLPVNRHLRAFKNCVVDLRTGARMPHRKDFGLTSIIPYDYEPDKSCPEEFRKFIANSFGEDMLAIVRAFTSMFLDPTAPYGRFPHLIGQSGGGKGTLGRFWNSMFGEDGCSSGDFANLATAEARHQYLTGKSIFAVPDAGGYVSGLRAFYELVDNGGLSGRALFNPVGYFKPWDCRFWVASVDHLQVENAGDGWARRAYPIPVRARTIKADPKLRLKLEACKADVISWALAMPRAERDKILLSPPENERVINLTLDSALYGDSTKSFVDLCLRPSNEAGFVPNHLLHTWYVSYCKEHGYTPLGMSKFISHLKTVLPRNFADRCWAPMVNGQRGRVAAHWEYVSPVQNAFVKVDAPVSPEAFRSPTPAQNPTWICIKTACEEGGLIEFENFWNLPLLLQNYSDNNLDGDKPPQPPPEPLPSLENTKSVQGVQSVQKNAESLERRNSGGVQAVQAVQGIGSDTEKNAVGVVEKLEVENTSDFFLTSSTVGGQRECNLDSYKVSQESVAYTEVSEVAKVKQTVTNNSETCRSVVYNPWLTTESLEDIASALDECPDPETLADLRECWPAYAMNVACKLLSAQKHTQVKQWVIELNNAKNTEPVQQELGFIGEAETPTGQPIDDRQYRVHSEYFQKSFEPCLLLKQDGFSSLFRHVPSGQEVRVYSEESIEVLGGLSDGSGESG